MIYKKIIPVIFTLLFIAVCVSLIQYFIPKNINFADPKTQINAKDLSAFFLKNEEKATQTYGNSIIKVSGLVKQISFLNNKNTIILHGEDNKTSIICEMNTTIKKNELPKKNDSIQLKGICKGFLKDVVLLNCQLIKK